MKRALRKLRVADEWLADPSRNRYEADYLEYVHCIAPGAVPRVLARGEGWFAMEYLDDGYRNWKSQLLSGVCHISAAERAGDVLRRVHDASRGDTPARSRFATLDNFEQLRIDPYLVTTGLRHPDLRDRFEDAAAALRHSSECLVHGDYSPKNLLTAADRIVVLDCEVAWFGDGAFDVAFLLNHLLLKALYHAPVEPGLRVLADAFLHAYRLQGESEQRVLKLVLLLMLARVDGKSPVEYLSAAKQELIRCYCSPRIRAGEGVDISHWFRSLRKIQ